MIAEDCARSPRLAGAVECGSVVRTHHGQITPGGNHVAVARPQLVVVATLYELWTRESTHVHGGR
jgi:hypothetical protein